MFTLKGLTEDQLRVPPVDGCECEYCRGMRMSGRAISGEGSSVSHRIRGGDERHNPENTARLALKKLVSEEAFAGYVSRPGGSVLWFQNNESGLWYASGRPRDNFPGHFVHVFLEKGAPEEEVLAWLCLPALKHKLPLASIVMMHYWKLTLEEADAWHTAAVSYVRPEHIPENLKGYVYRPYHHHVVHAKGQHRHKWEL